MTDGIRCSRCERTLDPEAFSPSHRSDGNWCKGCRKAYMASYNRQDVCLTCGSPCCGKQCMRCHKARSRPVRQPQPPRRRVLKTVPEYGQPGSSKAWRSLRQSVIDEEDDCGICGEPVDKSLTSGAKMPSVDHIMPIEWGGSNRRHNLQLAHRGCNSRAGRQMQDIRAAVCRAALWMDRRMSMNL